ncbi:hypothetical protein PhCBS80983_g01874 [Powellomyces hirtus]|uniref:Gem-associated protein 2 n=1 Tax=Powellomyces hirtus TaxID=109895 RepID=A0A507EAA3_9FUNG|nr:hypothetical protein PhCBS80983_g01874 [Powellomyces hirtus]
MSGYNNSGRRRAGANNGNGNGRRDWTQSDEDGLKRPALPLDGYDIEEPEFVEEGPPASGLQYLRMVRAEANACPQVMRVSPPPNFHHPIPSHVPDIRAQYFGTSTSPPTTFDNTDPPCPPHLAPSSQWLSSFLERFANLQRGLAVHRARYVERRRGTLYRPDPTDERAWKVFCYGEPIPSAIHSENEEKDGKRKWTGGVALLPQTKKTKTESGAASSTSMMMDTEEDGEEGDYEHDNEEQTKEPLLDIVCGLEHGDTIRLIRFHIRWISAANHITETQGQWLFALLMRLDPLLIAEEVATVRELCRLLRRVRAAMGTELRPEDPRAASLNMLVAIVANVFGQRDLADATTTTMTT